MTPEQRREVDEAVAAGRRALASLEEASEALESAGRWGVADIFLGGGLTSAFKHVRISKAQTALGEARAYLRAFLCELDDVSGVDDLRVRIGTLATAVDIFVDNPLVDIYVQRQIDDAQDDVAAAIAATRTVLARLEAAR